jgi:MYXO-CTERM domain-containing protein
MKTNRAVRRFPVVVATMSVAVAGLFAGGAPRVARACGGLFCNRPPPNPFDPLPIAQSGENIVFAVTTNPATQATTVEAHIQIFYAGPADKFSWIVPVDGVPEVSVGTDRMFTAVGAATQPVFNTEWRTEGTCKPDPAPPFSSGTGSVDASARPFEAGADGASGVTVDFRGVVGPYDTAIIHSTSSAALIKWLTDNMYFVPDSSIPIMDEYVTENKHFVAIKLLNGKDVRSIQPVVLKFDGTEPCVPLRLTAIAAMKDLPVNLWVLGAARTVPKNYFEIKLNEARINWLSGGGNYNELVKRAADEAGGNAFIAEYAGTARILDRALWPNPQINLALLRVNATPPEFLQMLVAQGLTSYGQTLPLLRVYIPEPQVLKDMGVSEAQFYANNAFYWQRYQADFAPFDPDKLTNEIDKAIVKPLRDGQTMFDAHPYLTRLATFISPEEMNRDPLFIFNEELPPLSNVHISVANILCGQQNYRSCEAPVRLDMPDGRSVWFRKPGNDCFSSYERGALDSMPALAIAYEREDVGEGMKIIDNSAMIAKTLNAHNQPFSPPGPGGVTPGPNGSGGGAPTDGGTGGTTGSGVRTAGGGGCGCAVAEGPMAAGAFTLMLALALLGRGRRSRRI